MDIIHTCILTDGQCKPDSFIRILDGTIIKTGPMTDYDRLPLDARTPESCPAGDLDESLIIDAGGRYTAPGFIDIHNHGAKMYDAMDGTHSAFSAIARHHLSHGVTAFLFTTMTASLASLADVLDTYKTWNSPLKDMALGFHLEGPFISDKNAGAHPLRFLLSPNDDNMRFLEGYAGLIKLITLSPDISDADRLLDFCRGHGIVASGGHDGAVDEEIYSAICKGMKSVTHMYCCTSSISRRPSSPKKHLGLTQIALMDDRLFCEVIADGCHVPYDLFKLIYKNKGYRRICLVSDAIRATGMKPGHYLLGNAKDGVQVYVTDRVALLPDESLYAGSITPISAMVKGLIKEGIPAAQAVYMASGAQAALLGLSKKGAVCSGFDADINLLEYDGSLLGTIKNQHLYKGE